MAIRTIVGLIPASAITNTMLAGSIAAAKLSLSDTFNFTGTLQKDGSAIVAGDSNLFYAVVDAATTGNIADLAAGAPDPVDGVSLSSNADILAWQQSTATQNGIYNADTVGTGSDGAWTRPSARDAGAEMPVGLLVYVKGGTLHGQKLFKLTTFAGTIGSDALTFEEHQEGLTVTNSGEPEALGTGDASNLNFDLSAANVVFVSVSVDGIMQAPGIYSVAAGAGAGGVDQLQFASGNAPASGAVVEATVFRRL